MKKLYLLSSVLGFISGIMFQFFVIPYINMDNFIIGLEKIISNSKISDFIIAILLLITFVLLLVVIFFSITSFLWRFVGDLRIKYPFSLILKINLFFIFGAVIYFILSSLLITVGPI